MFILVALMISGGAYPMDCWEIFFQGLSSCLAPEVLSQFVSECRHQLVGMPFVPRNSRARQQRNLEYFKFYGVNVFQKTIEEVCLLRVLLVPKSINWAKA